jgi:phospholipase C
MLDYLETRGAADNTIVVFTSDNGGSVGNIYCLPGNAPYRGHKGMLLLGGFRVPLIIVSPWTRGAYTFSQVSDHTSVIKLVEQRFGVRCPNVSPWRRAVVSDLLAAFDFGAFNATWPALPDVSNACNQSNWQCEHLPMPVVPRVQAMPVPETATRLRRPLPYEFVVSDTTVSADNGGGAALLITIKNTGNATGVFHVYDRLSLRAPRKFTVTPGKLVTDRFVPESKSSSSYFLSLHGPDGFMREFHGNLSSSSSSIDVSLRYHTDVDSVSVHIGIKNDAAAAATKTDVVLYVAEHAYDDADDGTRLKATPSAACTARGYALCAKQLRYIGGAAASNWYDFSVVASGDGDRFMRRFTGHMETPGRESRTDPAMSMRAGSHKARREQRMMRRGTAHAPNSEAIRSMDRAAAFRQMCATRRGQIKKDQCYQLRESSSDWPFAATAAAVAEY